MSTTSRVGTAVAAGYVLGRFKKMKLALIVGSAIAGKNLKTAGMDMLKGSGDGKSSPLVSAGRSALVAAASSSMDRISDRLHERSAALGGDDSEDDEQDEEPTDEGDESDEELEEDDEPVDEEDSEEEEDEPVDEDEHDEDELEDEEELDEEDDEPVDEDEHEGDEDEDDSGRRTRRRRAAAPGRA
jgi:hypothetical protein